MKKLTLRLLAVSASLSLLAACGAQEPAPSAARGPEKLVVTYAAAPLNVPSILERERGIFAQNLADLGTAVEYADITSGADQTQALASGDVQLLYAVGGTSLILPAANGADIKLLNLYSRSPAAFSIFSADSSIITPYALAGKTIAGPAGTNLHELLAAYLDTANMTLEDVNYVSMSIPDAKAALDGGSVDAALLAGPAAYLAQEQGHHKVTDGEGLISAIIGVAVTQAFYDANPEVIARIEQAQAETLAYMEEQEDAALATVAQALELEEAAVREMYAMYDFSTEITQEDLDGLQATADFMYTSGMIEAQFDVTELLISDDAE